MSVRTLYYEMIFPPALFLLTYIASIFNFAVSSKFYSKDRLSVFIVLFNTKYDCRLSDSNSTFTSSVLKMTSRVRSLVGHSLISKKFQWMSLYSRSFPLPFVAFFYFPFISKRRVAGARRLVSRGESRIMEYRRCILVHCAAAKTGEANRLEHGRW